MRQLILIPLLIAGALPAWPASPTPTPSPTPTIVLLPSALALTVGQQSSITATVYDAGGTVLAIPAIYVPGQSSATCAWVDQLGLVTAIRVGKCGIGAITTTGIQSQAPINVTVLPAPAPAPTPTPVLGFPAGTRVASTETVYPRMPIIGAFTGRQEKNIPGTIVGPCQQHPSISQVYCNVNFASGPDGWVQSRYLRAI